MTPDYSLATPATTHDNTIGDTTITNNYGAQPELGQVQATTIGTTLTTANTYEVQGASGSLLRKTGIVTPGNTTANPTTSYAYYGATESRQNPCNTSQTYRQAGMLKSVATASPDGGATPGVTTQTVYDDAGRAIATQTNSDGWVCTTYDTRGRVSTVSVPAYNGQAARTTSYSYAVNGNPLVSATWDSSGTITKTVDLLGRVVSYTDNLGDTTTTSYDTLGRTSSQQSPAGTKTFTYNTYDQLTDETFNSTDLAKPTYDQYGRLSTVTYPTAGTLKETVGYDSTTGAQNSLTYHTSDGGNINDTTTLTQSGKVHSDVVTSGSNSLWYTYGYNTVGQLTSANVGPHTYSYGYGTENGSCASGTNTNAGLNGNRTSQTIDGASTYYCYNAADQLVSSSDTSADGDQYDSHGNLTQIGSGASPLRLYYDSSDRNWGMVQYDSSGNGSALYYNHDVAGRISYREHDTIANWSWNMDGQYWYGFTGDGGSPAFTYDSSWQITEAFVALPGGVTVTVLPQRTTTTGKYSYNLPSLQGSALLTTDGDGNNTSNGNGPYGSFTYDPFGNPLAGSHNPQNLDYGSFGYKGAAQKITETTLALTPLQMGARVYFPTLGRFASMDPVPGGNANAYVYTLDPINFSDLSGLSSGCAILCVSASELSGMQSSIGATNSLQTTVSTMRVISSVAATATIKFTSTGARAAAKPTQHNNSTALAQSSISSVPIAPIFANHKPDPHPLLVGGHVGNPQLFNLPGAFSSAQDYREVGEDAGVPLGCLVGGIATSVEVGPESFEVGCVGGQEIGSVIGKRISGALGFVLGGFDLPGADIFAH